MTTTEGPLVTPAESNDPESAPPILDYAPPQRPTRPVAARSCAWGGTAFFLAPLVAAMWTDSLHIDPLPLAIAIVGGTLRVGSRGRAMAALALTAGFGLNNIVASTVAISGGPPPNGAPHWQDRFMPPIGVALPAAAWAVINACLLLLLLRPAHPPATPGVKLRTFLLCVGLAALPVLALCGWTKTHPPKPLTSGTTLVSTIDSDTGAAVGIVVGGFESEMGDERKLSFTAISPSEMQLGWTIREPTSITVGSPGYLDQTIQLSPGGPAKIKVALKKVPSR